MNDIENELDNIKKELREIHKSVKQTQNYFLWYVVVTALSIIVPVIGLIFYIPKFISIYTDMLQ